MVLKKIESITDSKPEVSVVMPAYNNAETITIAIESILNQTFKNFELIVINDNSADETKKILEHITDARLNIYSNSKNLGAGYSRNKGIKVSKGRYIAFCDADDLWSKNKLEIQLNEMKKNKLAFSYTSYYTFENETNNVKSVIVAKKNLSYKELLLKNKIGCLTAMYDTQVLSKKYFPTLRKRQDWGLWLIIMRELKTTMGISLPLAYYRTGQKGTVSSNKFKNIIYHWKIYREVLEFSFTKSIFYFNFNLIKALIDFIIKRSSKLVFNNQYR